MNSWYYILKNIGFLKLVSHEKKESSLPVVRKIVPNIKKLKIKKLQFEIAGILCARGIWYKKANKSKSYFATIHTAFATAAFYINLNFHLGQKHVDTNPILH